MKIAGENPLEHTMCSCKKKINLVRQTCCDFGVTFTAAISLSITIYAHSDFAHFCSVIAKKVND